MTVKEMKFGEDARRALEAGVDRLADSVAITLGKGRAMVAPWRPLGALTR